MIIKAITTLKNATLKSHHLFSLNGVPAMSFSDSEHCIASMPLSQIQKLESMQHYHKLSNAATPIILNFIFDSNKYSQPPIDFKTQTAIPILNIEYEMYKDLANTLNITSIPTLLLMSEGKVIYKINGTPPLKELGELVDIANSITNSHNAMQNTLLRLAEIDKLIADKQFNEAINKCTSLISMFPDNSSLACKCYLNMLGCYIFNKDIPNCKSTIKTLENEFSSHLSDPSIRNIYRKYKLALLDVESQIQLTEKQIDMLKAKEIDCKDNLKGLYEVCLKYCHGLKYDLALHTLLDIIKINRNWESEMVDQKLEQIFQELGNTSSTVIDARNELTRIFF